MAEAIDIHTHFVPKHIPVEPNRNPLWPSIELKDGFAAVMVAGKVFRVIDSRSWDAPRRLEDMAADDVDLQVVSPMPELLSHWFPTDDADVLCRHVNRHVAALCDAHKQQFIGIGMVPAQDVQLAAKRLGELKSLGLRGFEMGTHINGVPLGDQRLHDLYAAAAEANLAILVHPLHPTGLDRMGGRPELAAVAAFPLETAFAAVSLMSNGVMEKFPKLRIMLSHGGGALPWILPRLQHSRTIGPPLDGLFAREPSEIARKFYFDSIVYDPAALAFLSAKVGEKAIVVGSDYPFTIKQDRPAVFAEEALSVSRHSLAANAKRWLGFEG